MAAKLIAGITLASLSFSVDAGQPCASNCAISAAQKIVDFNLGLLASSEALLHQWSSSDQCEDWSKFYFLLADGYLQSSVKATFSSPSSLPVVEDNDQCDRVAPPSECTWGFLSQLYTDARQPLVNATRILSQIQRDRRVIC